MGVCVCVCMASQVRGVCVFWYPLGRNLVYTLEKKMNVVWFINTFLIRQPGWGGAGWRWILVCAYKTASSCHPNSFIKLVCSYFNVQGCRGRRHVCLHAWSLSGVSPAGNFWKSIFDLNVFCHSHLIWIFCRIYAFWKSYSHSKTNF